LRPLAVSLALLCGASSAIAGAPNAVAGAPNATAGAPAASGAVDVKRLYEVLGGKPGITTLVDDFVSRALKDERVRHRFDRSDVAHFKAMLVDQVCERLGGPCKYTGQDMRTAHLGMHISDAEYDALTEDFRQALLTRHIPKELQEQLLALRDHQRADIVEPHAERPLAAAESGGSATLRRAQDLHDGAKLLELADAARARGSKALAGQLFYAAELAVGSEALADLEPLYQAGAPPRVRTPLATAAPATPQPRALAAAAATEEAEPRPTEPQRPSLSGTLLAGRDAVEGLGYVTLTPLDRTPRAPAPQHRTMEQRGRDFAPHLLVVPTGSTVSFPNFDPVYHNVYSASEARSFDLGVYKNGQSRDVTFDKPGLVRVECNVHENMGAFIAVVSAPYATVADRGRFAFRALPAGRYKLRAWSERSGKTTEQDVVIHAGKNDLKVEVDGTTARRSRTDKFGNPWGPRAQ
jgi:truncated hemoglobin YjbI/plastocyanin